MPPDRNTRHVDRLYVAVDCAGGNFKHIRQFLRAYALFIKEYHNYANKPVNFHLSGTFQFFYHYRLLPYSCQQLQSIIKRQANQLPVRWK